ncbi:MAG: hypothetical protein N2504_06185 [candidate division WOR-3 bacterium]|nr:hypothetical protein [candidate division WOR-3 bacterium]
MRLIALLLISFSILSAKKPGYYYPMGPNKGAKITIGEVWNTKWNYGAYGYKEADPVSYNYPGPTTADYLYKGGLWIGAKSGNYFVSSVFYNVEMTSDDNFINPATGFRALGPGKSAFDVYAVYRENLTTNKLGVRVFERTLSWPNRPYNMFFGHEYKIVFDPTISDYTSLDSVYFGVWFDSDVCGAGVQTQFWYDDLVSYDGIYKALIDEDPRYLNLKGRTDINGYSIRYGMEDNFKIFSDTTIEGSDNVPDGYIVWGDELEERVISYNAGVDTTNLPTLPDGRKYIYLIPRGMAYIFDADDPKVAGDDEGDFGRCAGYNFAAWIYADPTPNDSVSGNIRIVRPAAHQWWNVETDPGDNTSQYLYMAGKTGKTKFFRFVPLPTEPDYFGAPVFDYRFLLTVGPYKISQYPDTIRLVLVTGVGYGLYGGKDNYYKSGAYMLGARNLVDLAYIAYYSGSGCDPGKPCASDPENVANNKFWKIPIPPPTPNLNYSASSGSVKLVWDNMSEITPDYVTGELDFAGYAIYRALYKPSFSNPTSNSKGSLIAIVFKKNISESRKDSIVKALYGLSLNELRSLGVSVIDSIVRTYEDKDVRPGFPYFYAVSSFDFPTADPSIYGKSQESARNNYKKDMDGVPVELYIPSEASKQEWKDKVRIVPNPFRGSTAWSATKIAQEIEIQNLPPSSRVDIFTLSGDHIITLKHNSPLTGSLRWNLLSKNGFVIAPGVYLVKITDDTGDYKLLKLMILR